MFASDDLLHWDNPVVRYLQERALQFPFSTHRKEPELSGTLRFDPYSEEVFLVRPYIWVPEGTTSAEVYPAHDGAGALAVEEFNTICTTTYWCYPRPDDAIHPPFPKRISRDKELFRPGDLEFSVNPYRLREQLAHQGFLAMRDKICVLNKNECFYVANVSSMLNMQYKKLAKEKPWFARQLHPNMRM